MATGKGVKRARRSAAPAAAQKAEEDDVPSSSFAGGDSSGAALSLLSLPDAVLLSCMGSLDARSLATVSQCSKAFRAFDSASGLRLMERVAKEAVERACGTDLAARWR